MRSTRRKVGDDRRAADRYPIERAVRYRVLGGRNTPEAGTGQTINISSKGVLFTTNHLLQPGKRLELAISWPVRLNDECPLKLVAMGRVVRFEAGPKDLKIGVAAIEIQTYDFRTLGAHL